MRSRRRSGSARKHLLTASSSGWPCSSLLSEIAEEQPLVCVVDDVQWLDNASAVTMAFVARRLLAESVGFVFAVRQPNQVRELAGFPELLLGGLRESDARALLESAWPGRLDEQVRDRVIAESRGNPLALLELPRGLTPAEQAGGFERPDAGPLTTQIEQSFRRQFEPLPEETRRLLLTAAAEPVGRSGAVVARCRSARARSRRGSAGPNGGADRARCTRAVPSPAGALGGVPGRVPGRPPGGASSSGRGDRSCRSTPIGARGIVHTRRRVSMNLLPMSSSALPDVRGLAAESPLRPHSSNERQS